jgi:ribosomal protein L20A (L18A)
MEEKIEVKVVEENLYSGFAIAIDENIHNSEAKDKISDIVEQIENKGIPLVKYDALPTIDGFFDNIRSVSFFVLDWELNPISEGPHVEEQVDLQLGDALKDSSFEDNVKFIESIKENCFAPIFIFTAFDTDTVIEWLNKSDHDLYNTEDESKNFILIRKKSQITGENDMFEIITDWIKSNPSIYTLKKWDKNFYKAKSNTFIDLFTSSKNWPSVLWKAYKEDSVDESSNIDELIYRNIKGRGEVLRLDETLIDNSETKREETTPEEIRKLISNSQFVKATAIPDNDLQPGDIFSGEKARDYFINIRPVCDTIIGRANCDGIAYCLKGERLSDGKVTKAWNDYGFMNQRSNECIIFGVDGDKFVSFSLKEIHQIPFNDIKDKRIQRLLPPHVTDIQQKYASYISRVGLPRLLKEILPSPPKENS